MTRKQPYKTSRDYKRLKELLDEGKEIVCFVDYTTIGYTSHHRDVCRARKTERDFEPYTFVARGIQYGAYTPVYDMYSFEDYMKELNVEFIEPDNSADNQCERPEPWHECKEHTEDVPERGAECVLRVEYREKATDIVEVAYITAAWNEYGWTEEYLDSFDESEFEVKITHWKPINKPKGVEK